MGKVSLVASRARRPRRYMDEARVGGVVDRGSEVWRYRNGATCLARGRRRAWTGGERVKEGAAGQEERWSGHHPTLGIVHGARADLTPFPLRWIHRRSD